MSNKKIVDELKYHKKDLEFKINDMLSKMGYKNLDEYPDQEAFLKKINVGAMGAKVFSLINNLRLTELAIASQGNK